MKRGKQCDHSGGAEGVSHRGMNQPQNTTSHFFKVNQPVLPM